MAKDLIHYIFFKWPTTTKIENNNYLFKWIIYQALLQHSQTIQSLLQHSQSIQRGHSVSTKFAPPIEFDVSYTLSYFEWPKILYTIYSSNVKPEEPNVMAPVVATTNNDIPPVNFSFSRREKYITNQELHH